MRPGRDETGTVSGAARLASTFAASSAEGRTALLPYLTAGLPDPTASPALFQAMAAAGADGFEIGIPYSDPLMDGPVIMEAGGRALAAGATVDVCIDIVAQVSEATGLPVTVMTYANPVLRMGLDRFCERVAAAGASGLVVADLPVDEASPFLAAAGRTGMGMVLFAAPTTDDARLHRLATAEPLFVYAVADLGVTGLRGTASSHLGGLVGRIRAVTDRPVVAGVGISDPAQAEAAATVADGVIVGTALVAEVLDSGDAAEAASRLGEAVAGFAAALRPSG